MLAEVFRAGTGDRFGERFEFEDSSSFSGDGEDPPVAEFRREADNCTIVFKCRKRIGTLFFGPSSDEANKNANGQLIHDDWLLY